MAQDCSVVRNTQGVWVEPVVQHDGVLVYFGLLILFVRFEHLASFFARPSTVAGQKLIVQAVQGGTKVSNLEPTIEAMPKCQECGHPKGNDWKQPGAQCPKCGQFNLT